MKVHMKVLQAVLDVYLLLIVITMRDYPLDSQPVSQVHALIGVLGWVGLGSLALGHSLAVSNGDNGMNHDVGECQI